MSLTESIVEDAALEWFEELGYAVGHGTHLVLIEQATERLCQWHLNYETVSCYPSVKLDKGSAGTLARNSTTGGEAAKDSKMRTGVSALLSRKPERYRVTKMKFAKTNKANLWATETMGNPKYPLELFLRVITVSLETMKIVKALPKLNI